MDDTQAQAHLPLANSSSCPQRNNNISTSQFSDFLLFSSSRHHKTFFTSKKRKNPAPHQSHASPLRHGLQHFTRDNYPDSYRRVIALHIPHIQTFI
jgi:hypothetical protein